MLTVPILSPQNKQPDTGHFPAIFPTCLVNLCREAVQIKGVGQILVLLLVSDIKCS